MLLCWPVALATLLLTGLFYWQCGGRLLNLAHAWQEGFLTFSTAAETAADFAEAGQQTIGQVLQGLLTGLSWGIFGLTMVLPGLLGLGTAILMAKLFRPTRRRYRQLRARVMAMSAALKMLGPMPDACHIYLYKRIWYEGAVLEPEMLLVSPGGVAVVEIRDVPGMVEGCVTDAVLYRRTPEGDVEKIHNPARRAVANVTRLGNFLASEGLRVWVTPCVVFVHPDASAYVHPPEAHEATGRRTLTSSCVITDATSFWEDIGRQFAAGRLLPQTTVDKLLTLLHKAPEKRTGK